MPTLTIRNLPEKTVSRLKERAQKHHRSMEQEVREILENNLLDRSDALERIEARWSRTDSPSRIDVDTWLTDSRTRSGSSRLSSSPRSRSKKSS